MKDDKTGDRRPARGYWMRPSFTKGGVLLFGPIQLNWYNGGFRVYLTWPGHTRTLFAR
jgi:hypothetical protein